MKQLRKAKTWGHPRTKALKRIASKAVRRMTEDRTITHYYEREYFVAGCPTCEDETIKVPHGSSRYCVYPKPHCTCDYCF